MANKIVCDICGSECSSSGRYEVWYKCVIRKNKEDICYECMAELKRVIRDKKSESRITISGNNPRQPRD